MNSVSWWLLGSAVGTVQAFSQLWTVKLLSANMSRGGVSGFIVGIVLRWLITGIVLALALQDELASGLMAFSGMFVVRWLVLISQNRR